MNRRGTAALEAVIASGLTLMLLLVTVSLFTAVHVQWKEISQAQLQRQWAALAFTYLDADMAEAQAVSITPLELRVTLPEGQWVYRVSAENSFYRGRGYDYYALAMVDSARWWREGDLLWVELSFPGGKYRCCWLAPGDRS